MLEGDVNVCTLKDLPIDYVLLNGSFAQHITHLAASGTSVALNYITECIVRDIEIKREKKERGGKRERESPEVLRLGEPSTTCH